MSNDEIIEQLNKWYFDENIEWWHKERLPEEEISKYHSKLLSDGNIITVSDADILCGYVEYWRITFEQFGRILCGEPLSAYHEDVITGQIGYVAHTYIRPEYRNGTVYRKLRNRFFDINNPCTHFVGVARRKKSEPVKVFKRKEIYG